MTVSKIRIVPGPAGRKQDKVVYAGDKRPNLVEAQRIEGLSSVRKSAKANETNRYHSIVNNSHPEDEVAANKFNTELTYVHALL